LKSTQLSRAASFVLAFIFLNLAWRGFFLPVSQSSYTDGILQINSFKYGLTYWPPLYGVMSRFFLPLPGIGLEGSARAVSWIFGAIMVLPITLIARRLFGLRAAIWAMIAWTLSPMAMRWSVQVMTDIPMCFFWMTCQAMLFLAAEAFFPDLFPGRDSKSSNPVRSYQYLLLASFFGVLACLTRYQGILLILPVVVMTCVVLNRLPGGRTRLMIRCLWPWIIILVWVLIQLEPIHHHFDQISDRSGSYEWMERFILYFSTFEDFLLHFPYYATWGFAGFMLFGFSRTLWSTPRIRWALWLFLFLLTSILALQAVFLSFQERYLLPLIPWVCIYAGHGMAIFEKQCGLRRPRFWLVTMPVLLLAAVMCCLVAVYQGQPFKDLKDAASYATTLNLPPDVNFLSNEIYNEKIQCVKTGFWLDDRDVDFLYVNPYSGELGHPTLHSGDIIIFTSSSIKSPVWGRTPEYFFNTLKMLGKKLNTKRLKEFRHQTIPIFPDLMQEGQTHQNPMAHGIRYIPQYFFTAVLQVQEEVSASGPEFSLDNRPPVLPPANDALTSAVETLMQERDELITIRKSLDTP
jgi:4-amino-4-deoxy-L-arabinose transferase-like glycosyltransferase